MGAADGMAYWPAGDAEICATGDRSLVRVDVNRAETRAYGGQFESPGLCKNLRRKVWKSEKHVDYRAVLSSFAKVE